MCVCVRVLLLLLQGDEPLIDPACIDAVVAALQGSPDAVYRCGDGGWGREFPVPHLSHPWARSTSEGT